MIRRIPRMEGGLPFAGARRKMSSNIRDQSKSTARANYARVLYGILCYPALRYRRAHSILSIYRNALIYKRKIFPLTVEIRPLSRQNFPLLISRENPRDLASARFRRPSTTIGRVFLGQSQNERGLRTQKGRRGTSITRAHHRTEVVSQSTRPAGISAPKVPPIWVALVTRRTARDVVRRTPDHPHAVSRLGEDQGSHLDDRRER